MATDERIVSKSATDRARPLGPSPVFAHFLLTRFNTVQWWSPGGQEPACLQAKWLDERFALFEALCLPSVIRQSSQQFTWVLFMHPATAETYRRRLESVVPRNARIVLAETAEEDSARGVIGSTSHLDFVVTTRLDNDDALSAGHLAAVQKLAPSSVGLYLNSPNGAQLDWATGRVSAIQHWSSPFLSRVEHAHEVRTVWQHSHVDPGLQSIIRQVPGTAMWLQGIHAHNVSNPLKGGWPMRSQDVEHVFGCDPSILAPTPPFRLAARALRRTAQLSLRRLRNGVRWTNRSLNRNRDILHDVG